MKILLRILVLFLLILSGVSLYLGIKLYEQREQAKARVYLLEQAMYDVSKHVETEQSPDLEHRQLPTGGFEVRDLKRYYRLDALGKPMTELDPITQKQKKITVGPETMRATIEKFLEHARKQTVRLDDTRVALRNMRLLAEEYAEKLARKSAELSAAETQIDELKDQVGVLNEEIVQLNVTVETKDEQIAALNQQLDEAAAKAAKQEDRIFDLQSQVTALEKTVQDLRREIERLKQEKGGIYHQLLPGVQGTITRVNVDWNFVLISTPPETKLAADITLVVRRGKSLVGKVKVMSVKAEENSAIAQILLQWLMMPMQEGDVVEYVRE